MVRSAVFGSVVLAVFFLVSEPTFSQTTEPVFMEDYTSWSKTESKGYGAIHKGQSVNILIDRYIQTNYVNYSPYSVWLVSNKQNEPWIGVLSHNYGELRDGKPYLYKIDANLFEKRENQWVFITRLPQANSSDELVKMRASVLEIIKKNYDLEFKEPQRSN